MNEQELIKRLKEGSKKAFDDIYNMYSKRLYAYCLQCTKSQEEAEEIVQDVFVRLWTMKETIRQEETIQALLFIIAKNYLINAYRSRLNSPFYEEYVDHHNRTDLSVDDTHCHVEYYEFMAELEKVMLKLPLNQQKVIRYTKLDQLTVREVAEKLSLSEQTVKNLTSMAVKTLRKEMHAMLQCVIMFIIIN